MTTDDDPCDSQVATSLKRQVMVYEIAFVAKRYASFAFYTDRLPAVNQRLLECDWSTLHRADKMETRTLSMPKCGPASFTFFI